jgi:hypothetical protein
MPTPSVLPADYTAPDFFTFGVRRRLRRCSPAATENYKKSCRKSFEAPDAVIAEQEREKERKKQRKNKEKEDENENENENEKKLNYR